MRTIKRNKLVFYPSLINRNLITWNLIIEMDNGHLEDRHAGLNIPLLATVRANRQRVFVNCKFQYWPQALKVSQPDFVAAVRS